MAEKRKRGNPPKNGQLSYNGNGTSQGNSMEVENKRLKSSSSPPTDAETTPLLPCEKSTYSCQKALRHEPSRISRTSKIVNSDSADSQSSSSVGQQTSKLFPPTNNRNRSLPKMVKKMKSKRCQITLTGTQTPGVREIQNLLIWLFNKTKNKKNKKGNWIQIDRPVENQIASQKCLLIVIPYLDRTTLDEKGSRFMPFLFGHQTSTVCMRSMFIKGTSRSCAIIEGLIIKAETTSCGNSKSMRSEQSCNRSQVTGKTENKSVEIQNETIKPLDNDTDLKLSDTSKKLDSGGIQSLLLSKEDLEENLFPLDYMDWKLEFESINENEALHEKTSVLPKKHFFSTIPCPNFSNIESHIPGLCQNGILDLRNDPDFSNLIALDCEMCETTEGKQVTRVSIVRPIIKVMNEIPEKNNASENQEILTSNEDASRKDLVRYKLEIEVLMDTLVKPSAPVTDYLERYSGVSENDLKDITVTIDDVRYELYRRIIRPSTIMIGHSLDNDLLYLRISHSRIIDTSVIYPHTMLGLKNSLKYLAIVYLNRRIQKSVRGKTRGHDSVEDALVPLELVLLKTLSPPAFGVRSRPRTHPFPLSSLIQPSADPSLAVYDSVNHDRELEPLCRCLATTLWTECGPNDEEVVRTYGVDLASSLREQSKSSGGTEKTEREKPNEIKSKTEGELDDEIEIEASKNDSNRDSGEELYSNLLNCPEGVNSHSSTRPDIVSKLTGNCQVHLCVLRDYQRLCHSVFGGIDKKNRPEDIYCVGKRINYLVDSIIQRNEIQKLNQKETVQPKVNDIGNDWLSEAFSLENKLHVEHDNVSVPLRADEEDEEEEEEDYLTQKWVAELCKWFLQNVKLIESIKLPKFSSLASLFPPIPEALRCSTLKSLDDYLRIFFFMLNPGDLFIVLSPCGNPLPYLGLTKLMSRLGEESSEYLQSIFPNLAELEHLKEGAASKKNDAFGCFVIR